MEKNQEQITYSTDKFIKRYIWRIIGTLIVLDAFVIYITPDTAIQGIIANNLNAPWFPYLYGSFMMIFGLNTLFNPDRIRRQRSAFVAYTIHTLLLWVFSTIPSLTVLIERVFSGQEIVSSDLRGIAPALKYTVLCLMVLIYENNKDTNLTPPSHTPTERIRVVKKGGK